MLVWPGASQLYFKQHQLAGGDIFYDDKTFFGGCAAKQAVGGGLGLRLISGLGELTLPDWLLNLLKLWNDDDVQIVSLS